MKSERGGEEGNQQEKISVEVIDQEGMNKNKIKSHVCTKMPQ